MVNNGVFEMLVNIDDKTYEMGKEDFEKLLSLVCEEKTGVYSIYCIFSSKLAMFIDENFNTKEELMKKVAEYARLKLKVKYSVKVNVEEENSNIVED